jgi:hypothetical protein
VGGTPYLVPMKKISLLLVLASFVIVGCMLFLWKNGISLSPAVLIKPSFLKTPDVIAHAVTQRLFPQLTQSREWRVFADESLLAQNTLGRLRDEIKNSHPDIKMEAMTPKGSEDAMVPSGDPVLYVQTFTFSDFSLSPQCENMKRLNYKCFVEVSLHKSRRKMKEENEKYFLMTSYMGKHFLLLLQN